MTSEVCSHVDRSSLKEQVVRIYFVPRAKIQPALIAMQRDYSFGYQWIQSCDYLKDEDNFAVQVVFACSYPYLETEFERNWQ